MNSHAGQFLYNFWPVSDRFLPGSPSAYLFSKPLNWLDFDRSYPRNPVTFGEYIRKWRKEQGISQVSLAEKIGVDEMTIVNWEVKRTVPRVRSVRERLTGTVEGLEKFLSA